MNRSTSDLPAVQALGLRIRHHVARMTHESGASHIGTALSIADILAVLYSGILHVDPLQPEWPGRDRFILSKGHGCSALYAVLAERGFFPKDLLRTFYQNGSDLVGHVTHTGVPGVDASSGSLGHGLPIACGMALAGKRHNLDYRVFTILSDGECDEGSTWEAALFAGHHGLDNLVAIIDYNKIQSLGRVEEVLDLDPLAAKWAAFRWSVQEVDGHSYSQLASALASVPREPGKPTCIVAHTVKGKGVSFMEDKLLWHYRAPDNQEYQHALAELQGEL